jgi:hypothetical protein
MLFSHFYMVVYLKQNKIHTQVNIINLIFNINFT